MDATALFIYSVQITKSAQRDNIDNILPKSFKDYKIIPLSSLNRLEAILVELDGAEYSIFYNYGATAYLTSTTQ